ncbi:hypothetical protein [Candidatus Frankia alpina]|nr:hypothetical protein [Candidatus Frankia alpina]
MLTPVQKSFDLPEQLATMTEMERFRRDLGGANRRTLALLLRSIPSIVQFRRVPHRLNIARERDKRLINSGLPFDYGSGPTVREAIADQNFQHYFQRSDREAIPKPPG